MECSIQLGSASLKRTFHLSTHGNICTNALTNVDYLYTIWSIMYQIIELCLQYICYDPNYNYESDEEDDAMDADADDEEEG